MLLGVLSRDSWWMAFVMNGGGNKVTNMQSETLKRCKRAPSKELRNKLRVGVIWNLSADVTVQSSHLWSRHRIPRALYRISELSDEHDNILDSYFKSFTFWRPPLWSSGQSSWLLTQRSRVRFPALPDFLNSSGSGKGSTQPLRE
jgi:hypothetical protein